VGDAIEERCGFAGGLSGVAFVVEVGWGVAVEVGVGLDLGVLLDGFVEGGDGLGEGELGEVLVAGCGRGLGGGDALGDVGAGHPEGESFAGGAVSLGDAHEGLVGAGEGLDEGVLGGAALGAEEEVGGACGGRAVFGGVAVGDFLDTGVGLGRGGWHVVALYPFRLGPRKRARSWPCARWWNLQVVVGVGVRKSGDGARVKSARPWLSA
jgi:hypothetical protein